MSEMGEARLSDCRQGTAVAYARVAAGHLLRSRLAAMGLVPGVRIRVIRQNGRGPVLIGVHGTRLALGRGMAERIFVREPTR